MVTRWFGRVFIGALFAFGSTCAAAAPFAPGNLVIYRVGSTGSALVNTGNAVFLDEYAADGTRVQSIAMPIAVAGANQPLIASGTATSEGALSRSDDGRYLLLTGYGRAPGGTGSISATTAATVKRIVGRVDAAGTVDTSTALGDFADANNPRSATSTDGSGFWVAGGAGGVRYAALGAGTSTQISSTIANLRQLSIFDGQLYTGTSSGSAVRIGTVGSGAPTTTGQVISSLPGLPTSTGSPYAFVLLDLDPGVPGVDTLYVADDAAGLLKYSRVGANWVANGSAGTGSSAYRGLTATVSGATVTLYSTRNGGSGATGGGELVRLVDASGYNGALSGTPSLLAQADTQTAFRGLALAPQQPAAALPDVVVYRVGDGSGNLVNTGNPVFLDQYAADGAAVRSLAVPNAASGVNLPLIASGTATSEGQLARSGDGRYVLLTGYGRAPGGSGSLSGTSGAVVPRIVGRMNADGYVNTRTALADFSSGNNPRSATSRDGSDLWVGGGDGGVRHAAFGASTSTQISTTLSNLRQVQIFDNQLYAATTSGSAIRIGTVGSGMPTVPGQTITNLSGLPATISSFSFALLDLDANVPGVDTLYVADDGAGLLKYSWVGGSWVANGAVGNGTDAYRSVTAIAVNGHATVYATRKGGDAAIGGGELVRLDDANGYNGVFTGTPSVLATAAAYTAFRGVALAPLPGGENGDEPTPSQGPTIAALPPAYSGVLGDTSDVAATQGIGFDVADATTAACDLTVTLSSDNTAVVPASALALSACEAGHYVLKITPAGVGFANLDISVTNADNLRTVSTLRYAASIAWAAPGSLGTIWPSGTSDGSTAQAIDADIYVNGADESQVLRLYSRHRSGPPLAGFDVRPSLELPEADPTREVDIEASTKVGNRIYWAASHTNSSSGALRPNRWRIFATDVVGSGSNATLAFVGYYGHLRDDLIAWDQANGNRFGMAASAAAGIEPKRIDGFNIEGLSFSPDGSVAWLAFRAPLLPVSARGKALLVPVTNFAALASGGLGHAAGQASFGEPILLDLGSRGFREIQCRTDGCLIVAGAVDGTPNGRLFTWSGNAADAPVERGANLSGLNVEGVVELPSGGFTDEAVLELVSDNGTTDYYATGQESKDLAYDAWKKFRVDRVRLGAGIGTTPAPFAFTAIDGVQRGATVVSESITISGLSHPASIALDGCMASRCEYAINESAFTETAGQVVNGDRVQVRQSAATTFATATALTLAIGGERGAFAVTTIGAPATLALLGGDSQQATVGTAFAAPLSLRVSDAAGRPINDVAVVFAAPASGASAFVPATVLSAADGVVAVVAIANAITGDYTVTARVDGIEAPLVFALTNLPAPPDALVSIGGDAQSTPVGTSFAQALVVQVTDANRNPLSGIRIAFTAPASGAGADLSASEATSDEKGIARVTARANAVAGRYTVAATVGPITTLFQLENTSAVIALHAGLSTDRSYVRYGATLNHVFVVRNEGPSTAHGVNSAASLSASLDSGSASWLCVPAGGATCASSGLGTQFDHDATIPAHGSLTYLLSATVLIDATVDPLVSTASVFADEATAPLVTSDPAPPRLVIYRDGFDANTDGAAETVAVRFDGSVPRAITIMPPTDASPVANVVVARATDGSSFRVERLQIGSRLWVRLVAIDRDGSERHSIPLDVQAGARIALALADDGEQRRVLISAADGLIEIDVQASGDYMLHASSGAFGEE
jgi:hypothetical protein